MLRLVDVSRYQVERADPLDLAKAKAAGYRIVNVALTGGRGYVSGPWASTYLSRASSLGMGRSVYHWLDGRTSGTAQAMMQLERMRALFGPALTGFAHFVDVEEDGRNGITPPAWSHVRDYVTVMQAALGRPIGIYSADYWWAFRNWPGAGLTPIVMGPPNEPVGTYPGDDSLSWYAGWGGWQDFSVMQWGVEPLRGTGDCSLSVIRDHAVWTALTGGDVVSGPMSAASWVLVPCLVSLRAEFNALAPGRDKASDGSIGDSAHSQSSSDHNPDETGATPSEDSDSTNEVHAIDVDRDLTGSPLSMEQCVQIVVARHRSGADNRLQNVIYNRRIWSRSWGWTERAYTGTNAHDHHAHFGARYTSAQEADTRPWGLVQEARMALDNDDKAWFTAQLTAFAGTTAGKVWSAMVNPEGGRKQTDATLVEARNAAVAVQAALAAGNVSEAARDAAQSAQIAQLLKLVETLAASSGAFTDAEFGELKSAMTQAAAQAGGEAADRVEAKLDSLREHLGDTSGEAPGA